MAAISGRLDADAGPLHAPDGSPQAGALETFGNELLGQELGSTTSQPDQPDTKQ
jgi:hypothetical protein